MNGLGAVPVGMPRFLGAAQAPRPRFFGAMASNLSPFSFLPSRAAAYIAPGAAPHRSLSIQRASLDQEVVLKDGTRARLSLLTSEQAGDMKTFLYGLSSYSNIKRGRCSDRTAGTDHAATLLEMQRDAVAGPQSLVVVAWAEVDGRPAIIGSSSLQLEPGTRECSARETAVADAFQGLGIATAIKKAQFEIARAAGMESMTASAIEKPMQDVYARAAAQLNLPCERISWPVMAHWTMLGAKVTFTPSEGVKS